MTPNWGKENNVVAAVSTKNKRNISKLNFRVGYPPNPQLPFCQTFFRKIHREVIFANSLKIRKFSCIWFEDEICNVVFDGFLLETFWICIIEWFNNRHSGQNPFPVLPLCEEEQLVLGPPSPPPPTLLHPFSTSSSTSENFFASASTPSPLFLVELGCAWLYWAVMDCNRIYWAVLDCIRL